MTARPAPQRVPDRTPSRVRPRFADWLVALGLLATFVIPSAQAGLFTAFTAPALTTVAWALTGAVMTMSLLARRSHPLRVWAVTSGGAALLLLFFVQLDPYAFLPSWPGSPLLVLTAPLVALYTLAARSSRLGRLACGGSVTGFCLLMFWQAHDPAYQAGPGRSWLPGNEPVMLVTIVGVGALITAWALGETGRARRESQDVRLAAEAAEKAEHDRAVAAEERARIARELHDITAHHISVVTLQAGTARLLAESGQPPSVDLLRGIENGSRQAMTEIRQALGVIRSTPDGAAPLPGLGRLPELVAQMGLAGLTVTVDGEAGDLRGSLDLTAYRIVQEGLTNVARHSQAASAQVTLRRGGGTLHITVTDNGPPRAREAVSSGAAGGHGLIGLRERLAGYGGRLLAGPRPDGGFGLRAMLPLRDIAGGWPPADTRALPPAGLRAAERPAAPLPAADRPAAALPAAPAQAGAERANPAAP